MKSHTFCGASAVAIALSIGVGAAQAQETIEEVVVTGSFIAGTPEDAALPVNTINFEDIKKQGAPSNLEIIRNISEIGPVQGESNRYNALPQGVGSINLRNLTSSRSVVIFNGRRLPNQIGSAIASQNTNFIPNAAIGRVDVLKDGGATTYGADAVGGVVNFITRKNYDGVEMTANARIIDGAEDLGYEVSVLAGKTFERGNILLAASYAHASDLRANERDWSQRDYLENNNILTWSAGGGAYTPLTATGIAGAPRPGVAISATGVVRDQYCAAIGGFAGFSSTASPACYFHLTEFDFLQEENNTTQVYLEGNFDLTDGIRAHGELLYSQSDLPNIAIAVGEGPARGPTGSANAAPADYYFTPGTNPAVRQFMEAYGYSAAQIAAVTGGGRVALPSNLWRLFGFGGNPLSDNGLDDSQHTTNETWRATGSLEGDLGEVLGNKLSWELAATYQYTNYSISTRDVLSQRLDAALRGLGGPSCNGVRADLSGSSGCFYFNPFSSAVAGNIATGQTNPGYVGTGSYAGYEPGQGLRNSKAMIAWLYEPIWIEREQDFYVYDAVLRGETNFELPGGPIRWAAGGQHRLTQNSRRFSDLANMSLNPCPVVGQQTCTNRVGPFLVGPFGNRAQATLQGGGERTNESREYPVYAGFGEINFPILDNLVINLSGRWEKFISDVTDQDNEVFVPAGSIRWQVNDKLALRATAGETFSNVDPPRLEETISTVNLTSQFGGAQNTPTRTFTNQGIKPETGFNYNIGAIWNNGPFMATVDYYNLTIDDYAGRTIGSAALVNAALQTPGTTGNPLLNCSSPLIAESREELGNRPVIAVTGGCNATSRVQNISEITYIPSQNSGTLKTSGIDVTARVRLDDIAEGTLTLSTDATYQLTYELSDLTFLGYSLAPGWEGLGSLNEDTAAGKHSQHIAEWRGSFSLNYARGPHNLNFIGRYVSSMLDDRNTQFVATAATNANPVNTATCVAGSAAIPTDAGQGTGAYNAACNVPILGGRKVPGFFTADLTYQVELPWDTRASLTIANLFDKDPPFARFPLSYDAFMGSPLGR